MARAARIINVADVIDSRPLSRFQYAVFTLCVITGMIDGFDSQSIAFVAATMAPALNIDLAQFGPVYGAANLGALIGALVLPAMGDYYGRRRLIIASVLLFAAFTWATALAGSYGSLMAIRFIAGLGLGGALPPVIALATEYAPRAHRAFLVTIVTSGFPLGAVLGGGISAQLIPAFGWQAVFYFGAALPLVLALALYLWLPESIRFLVGRDAPSTAVGRLLKPIARDLDVTDSDTFWLPEAKFKGLSVKHLFTEGRAPVTLLIWFIYFMNLFLLFFVYSWLSPLLQKSGFTLQQAIVATVLFNLGGVVGGILLGLLCDKLGSFRVLVSTYGLAAVLVASIGLVGGLVPALLGVAFLAGFCAIGVQTAVNPLTATLYPTLARGTGLGWAFGAGRFGTFFAPLVGGVMIGAGWGLSEVFLAVIVAPLSAGVAMLVLSRLVKGTAMDESTPAPAEPAAPRAAPTAQPSSPVAAFAAHGQRRGILGIDSVLFAVDDVGLCSSFLTDIGLEKRHAGRNGASFAVSGEQSEVRLLDGRDGGVPAAWAPGETLREIAWGVSDKDALRAIGDELSKDREVKEDAQGRLCVAGPFGMPLAFQVAQARHVNQPVTAPGTGRINSRIPTCERASPSHLGHLGLFCPDIDEAAAFYQRLGFRVSDRISEFGVFLRSPSTIDHHNVFFIKRDRPGLNHLNFRVADVDELGTGTTYLERRGWRPVWGLGRHYYGSHMFSFFDNPCGSYLEFTCDEDYILDDSQWQPVEYDPRLKPMTLWGGMPPKELYMGEKPARN